jgi:histidine phosphotransferase ChpT
MSPPHPSLARLLAARLCHDLGGAVATLAGTLELVEPGDPSMLELARETAQALRLRIRLYAAAWGGAPGGDLDAAGLGALLGGAPAVPRVRFALERLAPEGVLPAGIVPLALNAALLAAEALPQGGTVHLGGDAVQGLAAWPEGRAAAWPRACWRRWPARPAPTSRRAVPGGS